MTQQQLRQWLAEEFDAQVAWERMNYKIDGLMAARLDTCYLFEEGLSEDCAGPVEVRICGHRACENHTDGRDSVCLLCATGINEQDDEEVRLLELRDQRRWDA